MVVTTKQDIFEQSRKSFEKGDLSSTLEIFQKAMPYIDSKQEKNQYIDFLNSILEHCKENNLKEQEAIVLRNLGRIHSIFKEHVKGLKYHEESLKIQRKLGKSVDIANGLVFLAEDLEVSGNYEKCIKTLNSAQQIFQELGKLRKVKEINKEIARLEKFSKEVNEDEYYLSKFHLDL
ncbi:MAG: tetratricopeptide repeat protein [Promethearchaeota archaeon]